jgi:Na+-transporting NADH:ubiquinone oxidoreductase subunit F
MAARRASAALRDDIMLFLRRLHQWLGLIVGAQLILWTLSGSMFAWLDHEDVQARRHVREPAPLAPVLSRDDVEPAVWLSAYAPDDIHELRLVSIAGEPVWRVELASRVELRRAQDGQPLRLDEPIIRQLALAHYTGTAPLETLDYLPGSNLEARTAGPAWRAGFADDDRTTLYFAADDGRFIATRNSTWRVFDFFWMLHTMDYAGRDDFNNPLVITAGSIAVWLALSGLMLLTRSFRR